MRKYQHGFVRRRSVPSKLITFLKITHEALDKNLHGEIMAFYLDSCIAVDRVPYFQLLEKVAQIGGRRVLPRTPIQILKGHETVRAIGKSHLENNRCHKWSTGFTSCTLVVLQLH